MLEGYVRHGEALPQGYQFEPMAFWIEELLMRGHQVAVFTTDPTITKPQTFRGENLTIHIGRQTRQLWKRALTFFALERQDLVNAMRSDPVDIIHAHWTYEFAWAALDSGLPTLITAHDAPLRVARHVYWKQKPYRLARALMAGLVLSRTRYVTAVSPYVAEHLRGVYRYRGNLWVIPNGLPDWVFALHSLRKKQRSESLTFASVLIGWAGLKNGHRLLQAFSLVHQKLPNSKLLLFGSGHGPNEPAERWAYRNGLERGVSFIGRIPYKTLLRKLAEEVDVFVHPSLEESISMAVIEAMALGLPVIGGKYSGGVPFALDQGRCGILVDVRDPRQMAEAMLQLGRNPKLRELLGTLARKSAIKRFGIRRVWDQYQEAYADVLRE